MCTTTATITPELASRIMRDAGIRIDHTTVRDGIEQGVFPFGILIERSRRVFLISRKKFAAWLIDFCDYVVDYSKWEDEDCA